MYDLQYDPGNGRPSTAPAGNICKISWTGGCRTSSDPEIDGWIVHYSVTFIQAVRKIWVTRRISTKLVPVSRIGYRSWESRVVNIWCTPVGPMDSLSVMSLLDTGCVLYFSRVLKPNGSAWSGDPYQHRAPRLSASRSLGWEQWSLLDIIRVFNICGSEHHAL